MLSAVYTPYTIVSISIGLLMLYFYLYYLYYKLIYTSLILKKTIIVIKIFKKLINVNTHIHNTSYVLKK